MKKPLAKFGYKKLIIIMSAAVLLVAGIIAAVVSLKSDSGEEKVFFCDFENYGNTFSSESYYEDRTVFKYCESGGVDDSACLMIESSEANDARYVTEIKLKAKKLYLISGYVKTENIGGENAFGANISVMESTNRTIPTAASAEGWQKLEYCVRADKSGAVKLALRLGFYSGDTSGKVWFDNISVRRIKSVPDGMTPVDLSEKLGGGTSVTDGAEYNENTYNDMKFISLIIAAAFLTVFLVAYRFSRGYDGFFGGQAIEHPDGQGISLKGSIVFIFAAAVLLRIILAVSYYQCDFDVNLFKYWADTALNKGFTNVYGELGSNLDYPPVFLYFLYIASCLNKTLNFFGNAQAGFYTLLVKMPSILADCAIGYIIYYFARKKNISDEWRVFFTAVWLMNPLSLLDSACWGQVDSMLTLLIIVCIMLLNKKRYLPAGIALGFGVMFKPQMIIFMPIYFYVWLKDFIQGKSLKTAAARLGLSAGGFLIGSFVPVIPFLSMGMEKIELFGKTFNAPWIFSLFMGTAGHYNYATVNNYNFWFLLGKNWTPDSEKLGAFSIFAWGMAAIVIVSLLACLIHLKLPDAEYVPYLSAAFIYLGVACFGPRMHERYFFPAAALLLIAAVLSNKKIWLGLYGLLGAVGFVSVHEIMMGLLVGVSLKGAGASYEKYSYYHWPPLNAFRGTIAALMVLTVLMVLFAAVIDAFFGPKAGSLCNAPVFRESDGEALENVNLDSKEGKSNG